MSITKYFRSAIIAQSNVNIDFKNDKFTTVNFGEVSKGKIEEFDFFSNRYLFGESNNVEKANVIIALKIVQLKHDDGAKYENNIPELSALMFMPATLSKNGEINLPRENKLPWIPRDYLFPMVEPILSIGNVDTYNKYFESTIDKKAQFVYWKDYLKYSIKLFEYVTNTKFEDDVIVIGDEQIYTDSKLYIFEDNTVNSTAHVLDLYNELYKNNKFNKLYTNLTMGISPTSKKLIDVNNFSEMKNHVGQMGGEYPLSKSQRESVIHFNNIKHGDVLAVNGPPGTGKTTLLQSIVADTYVKHALMRENPPVIVASSTNNQAVTNVIDSFGKIKTIGFRNLEQRWIDGVDSFAVYFPSKGKTYEAEKLGYQYTNSKGEYFFQKIESEENRKKSKAMFIENFSKYFDKQIDNLSVCENGLHNQLLGLNNCMNKSLDELLNLNKLLNGTNFKDYVENIKFQINKLNTEISTLNMTIDNLQLIISSFDEIKNKLSEEYEKLPFLVRVLSFLPYSKRRIKKFLKNFVIENQLGITSDYNAIELLENELETIINIKITEKTQYEEEIFQINKEEEKFNKKISDVYYQRKKVVDSFKKFTTFDIKIFNNEVEFDNLVDTTDIIKINQKFDTTARYVMFWLAVHYYECRWLNEELNLSEKQMNSTFEDVIKRKYERLSMLTPCFVMTFFMLPAQFKAYNINDKKNYYMLDYIDLLIADEAGQTSPEIAACSFSLAKKSIVVGDVDQIKPVWGTTKALDVSLALESGSIICKEEFEYLISNGLNCSESSLMKIASEATYYHKYKKGLFLSEHRRCYDEIIQYCNDLVYDGKLEPLRGSAGSSILANILPSMCHYQVVTQKSSKSGSSRYNINEANAIVDWLKVNFSKIYNLYITNLKSDETINEKELFGIITPFKSQVSTIQRALKRELPEIAKYITVGTVHTFQGAERKVIIMSTVYGSEDGCFFIDADKSLMNVAVSRAKDVFLVFGDKRCLVGGSGSASGLLKNVLQDIH